jgi:hypothetical protein
LRISVGSGASVSAAVSESVSAFSKLEQFRAQKTELENKRPFLFADRALDDAILAVDNEIAKLSERIRDLANRPK